MRKAYQPPPFLRGMFFQALGLRMRFADDVAIEGCHIGATLNQEVHKYGI